MAQSDRGLRERVEGLESDTKKLETRQVELGVQMRQIDDKVKVIEQANDSLRLGQIERDLRDIASLIAVLAESQGAMLVTQKEILEKIGTPSTGPKPVVAVLLTCVTLNPTKVWAMGVRKMQLKSNQESVASLTGKDADGNNAALTFDAPPTWTSDDPSIVTVTPAPDGLTAVIGSPNPGPVGSAIVTLDAQVGGKALQATLAVDIIPGDAMSIAIDTAPPTDV